MVVDRTAAETEAVMAAAGEAQPVERALPLGQAALPLAARAVQAGARPWAQVLPLAVQVAQAEAQQMVQVWAAQVLTAQLWTVPVAPMEFPDAAL
jgi:hypothetical protein